MSISPSGSPQDLTPLSKGSNPRLNNLWKKAGYIPLLSTITGVARMIYGGMKAIIHGSTALCGFSVYAPAGIISPGARRAVHRFSKKHAAASFKNFKQVVRGAVESVPIAGNLACWGWDKTETQRTAWYERMKGHVTQWKDQ